MQLGTFFTGFCISAAYHLKELIARILIKGEISRVLPSSLFSQRSHLVTASRVYAGFGRKIKQKGECKTVYD
jgi:hypothetical protein